MSTLLLSAPLPGDTGVVLHERHEAAPSRRLQCRLHCLLRAHGGMNVAAASHLMFLPVDDPGCVSCPTVAGAGHDAGHGGLLSWVLHAERLAGCSQ